MDPLSDELIDQIASGSHHDPHSVLGQHQMVDASGGIRTIVRVRRPDASSVSLRFTDGTELALASLRAGLWQATYAGAPRDYRVVSRYDDAPEWEAGDPYRFSPTVSEHDLQLIGQGKHERLWHVLGAQPLTIRGLGGTAGDTTGTAFRVWAPRARAVRVVGDFNGWDGPRGSMRALGDSGVWELFVPGAGPGAAYKFEILTPNDRWVLKADPMGRRAEEPPASASIVTASQHQWHDADWMARRAASTPATSPMSIYELHLGSWRPGLSYRDAAEPLIEYVRSQGFTHVEFMPLAEHPYGPSWGYQVTGYFAPTSRYGEPDELRYLIDRLHQADVGVIMDWVPGHFSAAPFALATFDGLPLYERNGSKHPGHAQEAGLQFDYRRAEVRNFLVANALYWLEEFHVDGLRTDALASMLYLDYARSDGQWTPNVHGGRESLEAIAFVQELNTAVSRLHRDVVMIASGAGGFPGVTEPTTRAGLGFSMKWNTGWTHDTLQYLARGYAQRGQHAGEMTFSFTSVFNERFVLPVHHEEVARGKGSLLSRMPGDHAQKLANVRAYLAFMWGHPGKKLLFMGQEFGQTTEWSEQRGLDWWVLEESGHAQLHHFVTVLNRTYRARDELWSRDDDPQAFARVTGPSHNPNVIAFTRRDHQGGTIAIVANFSPVPVHDYPLDLPATGVWHEILNSDATEYGGTGVGNMGVVHATYESEKVPARAPLIVPPLGVLWLSHGTEAHVPSPTQG